MTLLPHAFHSYLFIFFLTSGKDRINYDFSNSYDSRK